MGVTTTTEQPTVTAEVTAADARLVSEILFDYAHEMTREDTPSNYERMRAGAAKRVAGTLHSAGWNVTR